MAAYLDIVKNRQDTRQEYRFVSREEVVEGDPAMVAILTVRLTMSIACNHGSRIYITKDIFSGCIGRVQVTDCGSKWELCGM